MDVFLEGAWLIPLVPLVSAGLLTLLGRRMKAPYSGWFALGASAVSFLWSVGAFVALAQGTGGGRIWVDRLFDWIPAGGFNVNATLRLDPLSAVMILLVTGVGSLIHLYAIGYMHGDVDFTRFFAYMNLFVGSMLVLVLGDNFLVMFVGWELVGACSYLLIGFWYRNMDNAVAAKKAFVTNRVGDFGFIVAMLLVFAVFGTLDFGAVFTTAPGLLSEGTATAICLLLLLGATGKSAQIPLYLWLPDAMAGPTPVSALIHAATMVTAGIYMIARTHVLFGLAPAAQATVAIVGIATCLFAAVIALGQYSLKKVLAYSTISQLGYMVAAVGVGGAGYSAGLFHLLTHGFFKALLFLCAGSVMHGMNNEEDMRRLGGLRKHMPVTYWTFTVGLLAIAGIFPFAGFWSKDAVLGALFEDGRVWAQALWAVGLAAAFLTAVYMFRQWYLTFWGEPRWAEGAHPHESPPRMTGPLVVLAVLATFGGIIDLPGGQWLHTWLEPVFGRAGGHPVEWTAETFVLMAVALGVALAGVAVATLVWRRGTTATRLALGRRLGPLVPAIRDKFYVDEAVQATIERPGYAVAGALATADEKGLDGAVNGIGEGVTWAGRQARRLQNGYVRTYAVVFGVGAVLVLGYLLIRGGVG